MHWNIKFTFQIMETNTFYYIMTCGDSMLHDEKHLSAMTRVH